MRGSAVDVSILSWAWTARARITGKESWLAVQRRENNG